MWRNLLRGVRSLTTANIAATHSVRALAVQYSPPALLARGPLSFATRAMKVVSSLKKRCENCRIVKRGTISYIYCSANPKHKARQGPKRRQ
mmetsp:Transcript_40120/g.80459  ORF Transcript_40120/g.80459 Transcript_40120/m.80459 type:complete len:91 (+) Transcript_40120:43-315(+)